MRRKKLGKVECGGGESGTRGGEGRKVGRKEIKKESRNLERNVSYSVLPVYQNHFINANIIFNTST